MSNVDPLDTRLREILVKYKNWKGLLPSEDYQIAQIKAALKDEGWVSPENAAKVQAMVNQMAQLAKDAFQLPTIQYIKPNKAMTKAQNLMSGQEFYDRLIKEVDHTKVEWPDNASNEYITAQVGIAYMEAAKRAAGLVEPEEQG